MQLALTCKSHPYPVTKEWVKKNWGSWKWTLTFHNTSCIGLTILHFGLYFHSLWCKTNAHSSRQKYVPPTNSIAEVVRSTAADAQTTFSSPAPQPTSWWWHWDDWPHHRRWNYYSFEVHTASNLLYSLTIPSLLMRTITSRFPSLPSLIPFFFVWMLHGSTKVVVRAVAFLSAKTKW